MRQDNPILGMLSKLADLLFLNLLILIGCLPIITIGASLTAGQFVALRIKRDEAKVFSDFFRSFKENLGQATAVWFIFALLTFGVLVLLWFYGKQSVPISIIGVMILLLAFMVSLWTFPLLSKFVYSTGALFRNSMILCCRYLFHTLGMLLGTVVPAASLLLGWYALPFILLFGLSLPVYIQAMLYNKVFARLEEKVQKQ